jgi:hypothetical protein
MFRNVTLIYTYKKRLFLKLEIAPLNKKRLKYQNSQIQFSLDNPLVFYPFQFPKY